MAPKGPTIIKITLDDEELAALQASAAPEFRTIDLHVVVILRRHLGLSVPKTATIEKKTTKAKLS